MKPTESAARALMAASLLFLFGCGGGGGESATAVGSDGGSAVTDARFAGLVSANPNCSSVGGATAAYFDFESGLLVNLSFAPLLGNVGGVASGGDGTIWSFPTGYAAQGLATGLIIRRSDSQVFFKHSSSEPLVVTPGQAFEEQLGRALAVFNLAPANATFICGGDATGSAGPLPQRLISGLYTAGQYTFIVAIRAISAGTVANFSTKVAAAPSGEFEQLAANVFLPMVWAQFPGGSGRQPQCSDGADNDGDLRRDFPNDPECRDPQDDDERVR